MLMRFSATAGWWMPMAPEKSPLLRSQPLQYRLWLALAAVSSSSRVKSEVADVARNWAPLWFWSRRPSPTPPLAVLPGVRQNVFWKFQYTTMLAASVALFIEQWAAVRKYILRLTAVLLISEPLQ